MQTQPSTTVAILHQVLAHGLEVNGITSFVMRDKKLAQIDVRCRDLFKATSESTTISVRHLQSKYKTAREELFLELARGRLLRLTVGPYPWERGAVRGSEEIASRIFVH